MSFLNLLPLLLSFSIYTSSEISYTSTHIIDFASPTPLQDIEKRYTAYDLIDGDLTNSLVFETEYTAETCTIGYYDLVVSVTNSRMKTTCRTDKIYVKDFIPPVIETTQKEIMLDISKEINVNSFLDYLIITDNLDTKFENIVVENLEELQEVGIHSIHIYVFDSSFNKSNVVTLQVHTFESVQTEILNDCIEIKNKELSKQEILSWFLDHNFIQLEDNSYALESNYFSTPHQSGVYQVALKICNPDETCQIYMTKIKVIRDNIPPKETKRIELIILISIISMSILGIILYRKRR